MLSICYKLLSLYYKFGIILYIAIAHLISLFSLSVIFFIYENNIPLQSYYIIGNAFIQSLVKISLCSV